LALQASPADEVILAEEEAVINRGVGVIQEVQTAFDVSGKQTEGTLLLTNRRLIYVSGGERREDLPLGGLSSISLYYADVEDLDSIVSDAGNFSISLDSIVSVAGHRRTAMSPKLEVTWTEQRSGTSRSTEFVQRIIGGSRRKNIDDWGAVIERLKSGKQKIVALPPPPAADSLPGRVLYILGDMQEKGLFTLESEVSQKFGLTLDPEQVEEACRQLVAQGLTRRLGDPGEDPFFQKVSPLGDDDLDE
jgi:hypothetical protein